MSLNTKYLDNKLALGLMIMLAIACPFFFVGGPSAVSPLLFNHLWNLGHIVFFGGATLLILQFISLASWRAWLVLSVSVFLVGVSIEFLQKFVGRESSWDDVLHNLCGVWFALFWGQRLNVNRWMALSLRVVSLALITPSFWFTFTTAVTDFHMRAQFPMINSFETDAELQQVVALQALVTKQQVKAYATEGNFSLAVTFGKEKYSGIRWVGPYGDWSHYHYFAVDIYNAEKDAFGVTLKVADFQHDLGRNSLNDRLNRRITLTPGWNFVRIPIDDIRHAPAGRVMQMDKISGLQLITKNLDRVRLVYLDNLRLE